MTHDSYKQGDTVQLQQLVRHLQAELNKYKAGHSYDKSELEYETDRLRTAHEELVYKNKKLQKRNNLYEKQLRTLTIQRDEAITAINHYKEVHDSLDRGNDQLTQTLHNKMKDLSSEIKHALKEMKMEKDDGLKQIPSLISEHILPMNAPDEEPPDPRKIIQIERVNRTQADLIAVLEKYVQELSDPMNTH